MRGRVLYHSFLELLVGRQCSRSHRNKRKCALPATVLCPDLAALGVARKIHAQVRLIPCLWFLCLLRPDNHHHSRHRHQPGISSRHPRIRTHTEAVPVPALTFTSSTPQSLQTSCFQGCRLPGAVLSQEAAATQSKQSPSLCDSTKESVCQAQARRNCAVILTTYRPFCWCLTGCGSPAFFFSFLLLPTSPPSTDSSETLFDFSSCISTNRVTTYIAPRCILSDRENIAWAAFSQARGKKASTHGGWPITTVVRQQGRRTSHPTSQLEA